MTFGLNVYLLLLTDNGFYSENVLKLYTKLF